MLPYEHSPAPVQENKNQHLQHHQQDVSNELVPLEPNFDDQNVSDMDLLSALCAVEDEPHDVIPTTSSNSMAICNKIMNNLQLDPSTSIFPNKNILFLNILTIYTSRQVMKETFISYLSRLKYL